MANKAAKEKAFIAEVSEQVFGAPEVVEEPLNEAYISDCMFDEAKACIPGEVDCIQCVKNLPVSREGKVIQIF